MTVPSPRRALARRSATGVGPPRPSRRRRLRPGRTLLGGLLAGALLAGVGLAGVLGLLPRATPAQAVEPEPQQVSITLTELTPQVLGPDDTLTVRGTATNTRDTPVLGLQLLLWRDQGTLYTEPAQLADLDAAPSTLPVGARLTVEGAFTETLAEPLAPGASTDFEVSASVSDLALPPGDGAALVGVHARENTVETVGRSRTLVPVVEQSHPAVPVTSLVLLSAPPSRLSAGVFADESLGRELEPGGRLEVLLDHAGQDDVDWAVDPLLLDEVAALAAGYQVVPQDEPTVAGEHQEAATAWLSRWEALGPEDGYRLPWGLPDALAVGRSGDQGLRDSVVAAQDAASLGPAAELPLLWVPADGVVEASTLGLVDDTGAEALLTGGTETVVRDREGATPVVEYGATAFTPTLGPDPRDTAVQARQALLSRSLIRSLTAERLGVDPGPELRLVTTPERATLDAATDTVAWQARSGLAELLATEALPWPGPTADGDLEPAEPVTGQVLAGARKLREDARAADDLLAEPGDVDELDRSVSAALSTWWRTDRTPAARTTWLAPRLGDLESLLSGSGLPLGVPTTPVSLTGRSGQFPVTLSNDLDQAVRVRIDFTTDDSGRLRVDDEAEVVLEPGESWSGIAQVNARANGQFDVTARLSTVGGMPFGPTETVRVRASDIGRAGWVIVVGSGVVLVGGTVLRVRQVRGQRTGSEPLVLDPDADTSAAAGAPGPDPERGGR